MNLKVLISAIFASLIAVVGCSSDSNGGSAGSGGDAGSGGSAGEGGSGGVPSVPKGCDDMPDTSSYIVPNAPPTATDDCDITLDPTGTNDHAQIIDALVDNDLTNKSLCLGVGTWDMGGTIGITDDPGLTLKGIGPSPDDVVLEYADENGDCRGAKGISVGVDDVTIENMWVRNTCENAVEQRDTDGSVMRKVRVSWNGDPETGEPITANGAYGIYPTDCQNTLVEYCQVQGASDAGIYIGKCTGGLVENNIVYENVGVDASNNSAFNNVGGVFALQQDIAETDMQSNTDVRLFDNESYCNNHVNFAKTGSAVSGIPVGSGIINLAGDGVEVFGNIVTDNLTFGIGLASNILFCQLGNEGDCPPYSEGYDPYVRNYYVHDNLFTNNGTDPQGDLGTIFTLLGLTPVADVAWDGYKETPETDAGICLGTDAEAAASIVVFGDACQAAANEGEFVACVAANQPTDQEPYLCEPQPE